MVWPRKLVVLPSNEVYKYIELIGVYTVCDTNILMGSQIGKHCFILPHDFSIVDKEKFQ